MAKNSKSKLITIEDYLNDYNLTKEEFDKLMKKRGVSEPQSHTTKRIPYNAKRLKFLVVSDTHIGHKNFRPDILEDASTYANRFGAEFILMPGDILEGMSGREGHIYELSHLGATNQLNYAEQLLGIFNKPIYAITATNSHDGWFSSKNNAGLEVGPDLERRVKNFEFLGYDEADLVTDNGIILRMTHPGSGTAYAISYKLQKYLNSLSGGKKPHFLAQGHYHKALYMFYRNVHAIDAGTLQEQTSFMRKTQSPAMLGFWSIDLLGDKKGIQSIRPEFHAYYE